MGVRIAQTQPAEKDLDLHFLSNPFVPPRGDVCYINSLPPELLSRIFETCVAQDDDDDDDDEYEGAEHFDSFHDSTDDEDASDSDVEMKKSIDKESDEEEGDPESDSEDEDSDEEGEEDSDETSTDSSDFEAFPPPQVVVSHVCRHWRDVALSTPSLWTTIIVTPEARPPYEPVSTLLERSKGLPIDLYVDCEPHEHEVERMSTELPVPTDDDLEFLFRLLTPHVHRWRTLEVSVAEYHHMFVFLNAVSDPSITSAPQLTTLELYHHEDADEFDSFGYRSMSKHSILFGGHAPSLRSVILWGVHVDWNQPWIASASNLVELELAFHAEDVRPSWAQFVTILRGASSLQKLNLRQSGPYGEPMEWFMTPTAASPPDLNAPVQLSNVTELTLAYHSQTRAIGFVQKLAFPALKHLALDFDGPGDYAEFVRVLAEPVTSSCSPKTAQEQPRSLLSRLESLKLAGIPCGTGTIEALYGELQNVTSLNISLSYLSETFLEMLGDECTLPGRGAVWLPRLATLYVAGTSGSALRDAISKRKAAGVPVRSLYVEESCELRGRDVEWFRKHLKTFEFFEGSDEEDVIDFEDMIDEVDESEWSDVE